MLDHVPMMLLRIVNSVYYIIYIIIMQMIVYKATANPLIKEQESRLEEGELDGKWKHYNMS